MDSERIELQIAALLDQADREHARVLEAIAELKAAGQGLRSEVRAAASACMQEALKGLQGELGNARQVVRDLLRVSLWRSALQHVVVAVVAIGITLGQSFGTCPRCQKSWRYARIAPGCRGPSTR